MVPWDKGEEALHHACFIHHTGGINCGVSTGIAGMTSPSSPWPAVTSPSVHHLLSPAPGEERIWRTEALEYLRRTTLEALEYLLVWNQGA